MEIETGEMELTGLYALSMQKLTTAGFGRNRAMQQEGGLTEQNCPRTTVKWFTIMLDTVHWAKFLGEILRMCRFLMEHWPISTLNWPDRQPYDF